MSALIFEKHYAKEIQIRYAGHSAPCGYSGDRAENYLSGDEDRTDFLDRSRNPRPVGGVMGTGYVGPGWVWPIGPPTATLTSSCCRNIEL